MKRPFLVMATTASIALFAAGAAKADCKTDLSQLPKNFAQNVSQDSDLNPRQVRRIHQAAKILARAGFEDACAELVDVLNGDAESGMQQADASDRNADSNRQADARKTRETRRSSEERTQADARDTQSGEANIDPEMKKKAEAARPVVDREGRFSTNGMIGAEVYSSITGEAVGDIEDILMGSDTDSVVIGHGGLLGLGEKRIKVALEDLRLNPHENMYFLAMTAEQIEATPAVVKKDNRWVVKPAKADRENRSDVRDRNTERTRTAADNLDDKAYAAAKEMGREAKEAGRDIKNEAKEAGREIEREADEAGREIKGSMRKAEDHAEQIMDDAEKQADKAYKKTARATDTTTGSVKKLSSGQSTVSADQMIGSWVYTSTNNEKVGEIEDLLVSLDSGDHSIILGHGGFLGLGEKRIKINISDLRHDSNSDRFYVQHSEEELKQAPGLKRVDGRWVAKATEPRQSSNKTESSKQRVQ